MEDTTAQLTAIAQDTMNRLAIIRESLEMARLEVKELVMADRMPTEYANNLLKQLDLDLSDSITGVTYLGYVHRDIANAAR